MSSEWMKSSISELIKAYKEQENLYNQKHKLYYNKQARNNSLRKILEAVQKNRDDTTLSDITKKIQTLRTQFGQEVAKIEKSTSLGGEGDELIYKPKIWWFAHLEWIGSYMKTRLDATPLTERTRVAKVTKMEKPEDSTAVLFEFQDDEIDDSSNLEQFTTEIEYAEYDADTTEPPPKKQKTYQTPKTIRAMSENQDEVSGVRTIEYTLINEDDTNEVVQAPSKKPVSQFVEFHEADYETKQTDKLKRRSKAFGKYVAALMMEISDDKTFFELQKNITNSIHEAGIKQLQSRKS